MNTFNYVGTASPLITSFRGQWSTVDTILGGTTAMRAAGKAFLPQEKKEKDENYIARLNRSTFDNYYKEALDRAVDKVFSQDIQLSDQAAEVVIWAQDVDQQGRDLTQFAKDIFFFAMHHGVTYILTDYPRLPQEGFANRAEELASGRRPYWVHIKAPQVLAVDYIDVGGSKRLGTFRYQEQVYEPGIDGVTVEKFEQVREFKQASATGPVECNVWRSSDSTKEWVLIFSGILTVDQVPVVPMYGKREGFFLGSPVQMQLAELNLQHWRKRSDLDNILHIANVPFLFGKGFGSEFDGTQGRKKGPIEVDIQQAVMAANKDADLKWVEHNGANIKSAMEDLQNLEDRMRDVGSTLFSSGGGFMATATEKAINAAEANARLKSLALSLKDCLEFALYFVYQYMGLTQVGTVEVNTSFATDYVSQETFAAVLTMYKMGLIDYETVVNESKRRNIIAMDAVIVPPKDPNLGKTSDTEVIPPVVDAQGNKTVIL